MHRSRFALATAGVILALAGGITCTDVSGPRAGLTHVGVAPQFTRRAEDTYKRLAQFHLELDNIRLRLKRADGSPAVDTVVAVNPGTSEIAIQLTIRITGSEERLEALIDLRAGELVLFSGSQTIVARSAGRSPDVPPIAVEYVGPGADAVDVVVTPAEASILSNQTVTFEATAFDANEQALDDILVDWSVRDASLGSVSAEGVFTPAPGARGTTYVIATLPTDVKDSARVTVSPVPTQALLVSGGGQSGAMGQPLAPFVFEVRAADDLPVAGVPVTFELLGETGGHLSTTTASTGADGRVSTTLTLGNVAGIHIVRLLVADVVFATTSAIGGAGQPTALQVEGTEGTLHLTTQAGQPIPTAYAARVVDALGTGVPNVQLRMTLTPEGSPEVLQQVTPTTDQEGRVLLSTIGVLSQAGAFDLHVSVVEFGAIPALRINIDVVPGASASLAFATQPPTAQAGAPFTVAVAIQDQLGNFVTSYNGPVTVALANNQTGATLAGTLTRNAVSGVATFDDLAIQVAGTGYTLDASAEGLATATSIPFGVDPGAPVTLAFIGLPTTVAVGGEFSAVVAARDAFANTVTDFTGAVTIALANNPGQAVLGGTLTVNAISGIAQFDGISVNVAATGYTLAASSASLTGTSTAFDAADSQRFVWVNAAGGNWSDPANWDRGAIPGPADTAIVALDGNYIVVLDQSASVATIQFGGTTGQQRLQIPSATLSVGTQGVFTSNSVLELSGGSIDGAGGIILSGQFYWTGGTLTGAGSIQTAPGSLTEINGGTKVLTQRIFAIGGNATWQGGDISAGSSGQMAVITGGSLNVAASVGFTYNLVGGLPTLLNGGTLTTAGTITISGAFSNGGTLDVQSGTLVLTGGGAWSGGATSIGDGAIINFAGGAHALGGTISLTAGEVSVTGGTVSVVGTYSSTGFTSISGGTLTFDGAEPAVLDALALTSGRLGGGGIVNVANQFTWSGGVLDGAGTLAVTGTTTIDGGAKTLQQRTLNIGGPATWTSGNISAGSSARMNVLSSGSLSVSPGLSFSYSLVGGLPVLANAGTFSTGGGTVSITSAFDNSGTLNASGLLALGGGGTWSGTTPVNISSGAVTFSAGNHALGSTVSVTGAGEIVIGGGNVSVTGAYTAGITSVVEGTVSFDGPSATTSQLIVNQGTVSGGGVLVIQQNFEWLGGTLAGTGVTQVAQGATTDIFGGPKQLTERTLSLADSAIWTAGQITASSGGTLRIESTGALYVTGDVSFLYNQVGGVPRLVNLGSLQTSGAVTIAGAFDNAGGLLVIGSTLTMSGGGSWSGDRIIGVANGAVAALTGGTFVLERNLQTMGTQSGTGIVRFGGADFQVNGLYTITGATEVTSGRLTVQGDVVVDGQLTHIGGQTTIGGDFIVNGAFGHSGGDISVAGNTTFAGQLEALSGGTLALSGNFSLSANGDNRRMISTAQHVTRFVGTGSGRTLHWDQPPVQTSANFGVLEFDAPGAEGIILSGNQQNDPTTMVAAHVIIRRSSLFRISGAPQFVLIFGGATNQGIVIEDQGQFDNQMAATVQIANPLDCNPALELVRFLVTGPYTCVSR